MKNKNRLLSIFCAIFFVFVAAAPTALAAETGLIEDIGSGIGGAAEDVSDFFGQSPHEIDVDIKNAFEDAGKAIGGFFSDIFAGEEEEITSFINFKGGLQPPTGEGLDPTITRSRNLRDFIRNTLNFALSFLGIIAVAIVIYGGFLYVTAAGNEEQSGKGKKAIQYAAIGILIIIGSFAIVNTLVTFVGGEDSDRGPGGTRGTAIVGTNLDQQGVFNLAANTVNATLRDFAKAYRNLVASKTLVKQIADLPAPSGDSGNRAFLNTVHSGITQLKNNTDSVSKTHVTSRKILEGWVARNERLIGSDEINNLKQSLSQDDDWKDLPDAIAEDFKDTVKEFIGEDGKGGRLAGVKELLGQILEKNAKDYLNKGQRSAKDIERILSGLDSTATVKNLYENAINALKNARDKLPRNHYDVDTFKEASSALYKLSAVIQNIEFVFVRIKATVKEGNAPLIVELNGLDSRDPTGETVANDRSSWDPGGKSPNVVCSSKEGPSIVCTYHQAGTYMASLEIESSDPSRVATGKAFLPITVQPNVARISLKATIDGLEPTTIREFKKTNKGIWNLETDIAEFQITESESKNPGITFDASATQAGGDAQIKSFTWNFGDGSQAEEGGDVKRSVRHVYKRSGTFPLRLEVTDSSNRKDRKLINIIISNIAARVAMNKSILEPDELAEFDGGVSRSDRGGISSYEWKVIEVRESGEEEITHNVSRMTLLGNTTSSVLRVKFKKPGEYRVSLTVGDGSETAVFPSDNRSNVSVTSRRPRANFTVQSCPEQCVHPGHPSVIAVDAGTSFDPDGEDLEFTWNIFDSNGNELERGASFEEETGFPACQGSSAKKRCFRFQKTGTYQIKLSARDGIETPNAQQTDEVTKQVTIASTVEAAWAEFPTTARLVPDEGGRMVFRGSARNANRIEIDFGDGQSEEKSIENVAGERFEITHDYANAGNFLVTLTAVSDEGNGENSITRRVYISAGDAPIAVIQAFLENVEFVPANPTPENPKPALEVLRNKVVKFDTSDSVNAAGKRTGLRYSWDFGDNKRSTGAKTEHTWSDVSPEDQPYMVTLIVSETADPSKTSTAKFPVMVTSKAPTAATLSLEKKTAGDATPIDVELKAEGAKDPDGRITNYQFWYFDAEDRETKRAVTDTQTDHATLTVETDGAEGEEHEYLFCVSITDNENTVSECSELWDDTNLPKLKVKNGPNQAPTASFSADRTFLRVGESVVLTSSSQDADGEVKQYVWDFEGDGFHNDNPTELSTVTHKYERKSPGSGYRVKLKVIDDKGAAGFSRETPVFVSVKSNPPVAQFTYQGDANVARRVKFFDASQPDRANEARIVKWSWDFDTSAEYGCSDATNKPTYCDGNKGNDIDSSEQNPVFNFPASGTFQVKLTVEDSDGNISEPATAVVSVLPGSTGGSDGDTPVSGTLRAEFTTRPVYDEPTIDGAQKKVISFPKETNGEPVSLLFGDSTGDIISYTIDKNTWCDSNGDGNPANDEDFVFPNSSNPDAGTCVLAGTQTRAENCWTTTYFQNARTNLDTLGRYETLLTVKARRPGNPSEFDIDTDVVEVRFGKDENKDGRMDHLTDASRGDTCEGSPPSTLRASIQKMRPYSMILAGIIASALIILAGFNAALFLKKGKKRI